MQRVEGELHVIVHVSRAGRDAAEEGWLSASTTAGASSLTILPDAVGREGTSTGGREGLSARASWYPVSDAECGDAWCEIGFTILVERAEPGVPVDVSLRVGAATDFDDTFPAAAELRLTTAAGDTSEAVRVYR